jgi:hypothetical protein
MTKPSVLILCTGNSCRSHLAEGILRSAAGDLFDVHSAGSRPAGQVHSLKADKLAGILALADRVLPSEELPVEVEFDAPYVSQFTIQSAEADGDAVVFCLAPKHTDCLAREQCGVATTSSSCSPESGCC